MSRTHKQNDKYPKQSATRTSRRDYRLATRAVRRPDPDLHRMGRALIQLAIAEAEANAAVPDSPTGGPQAGEKDRRHGE